MDESPIERLTEGQRACLRLVLQHKQTKQIARELGIAPDTVKQRIGFAMRALSVDSRVEAALLLQRHEDGMHTRSVYPPRPVADLDQGKAETPLQDDEPVESGTGRTVSTTEVVRPPVADREPVAVVVETEAAHDLTIGTMLSAFAAKLGLGRPEPANAGAGNRLSTIQRILVIVLIAIGSILSITGLVSAAEELVVLRR